LLRSIILRGGSTSATLQQFLYEFISDFAVGRHGLSLHDVAHGLREAT
jgi:hypothetical protein